MTSRQSNTNDPPGTRTVPALCGVCPGGCGVELVVRDQELLEIRAQRGNPHGHLCRRGVRAAEVFASPDRLLHPQRRSAAGRLERCSWDEAYELWVGKLREIAAEHGPEAVCVYTGRGNFDAGLNATFPPAGTLDTSANAVLFPFGSPNTTGVGAFCFVSYGLLAPLACFGEGMEEVHAELEEARLIVIWGANPATDSPPTKLDAIRRAVKQGARVVVIDHRRSETARAVESKWLGIRPGTDGALALGLLHVMIEEELYDPDFVERSTHGFEELREYVRGFPTKEVARITGVPAEDIRDLARDLARTEGCSVLTYTGLEYSNSGVQALRGMWSVQALAGNLDTPGGNVFKPRDRVRFRKTPTEPPPSPLPVGAAEYPLYHQARKEAHGALLPRAILEGKPYPIRGLIVAGASLITSWPDPDLWRRALSSLDLLVVIDRFPTADAEYADLVLPATTGFESLSVQIHDDNFVQLRPRALEPRGEARSDALIFTELARRLGYGDRWPGTEEEMAERLLADTGLDLEELRTHPAGIQLPKPARHYRKWEKGLLRDDGEPGFRTPTGRFEFTSEWFRQHGYEPLPVYTEPVEGPLAAPELAREFPLALATGARTQYSFRSQHRNIPSLVKREPFPLVHLHTGDAERRRIADGDPVLLKTPRGEVPFRARVSEDIQPGVVEANMGGGGPLGPPEWRRANVNALTDLENRDPISGYPVFKALLCEVIRDDGEPAG